jgi:hypothetical protein
MAFMFRLEQEDGAPADPSTLKVPFPTGTQAMRSRWEAGRSA